MPKPVESPADWKHSCSLRVNTEAPQRFKRFSKPPLWTRSGLGARRRGTSAESLNFGLLREGELIQVAMGRAEALPGARVSLTWMSAPSKSLAVVPHRCFQARSEALSRLDMD